MIIAITVELHNLPTMGDSRWDRLFALRSRFSRVSPSNWVGMAPVRELSER